VNPSISTDESVRRTMTFGYPGDGGLGDRLISAVLRGEKTATSSLAVGYLDGDEPLPRVGQVLAVVNHDGVEHARIRTTRVRIVPLHLVDDQVAHDEGEGFADASEWRRDHVAFWNSLVTEIRAESGDPDWELRDAEPVVIQWFELLSEQQPGW
jgi:uncharacterized protein YhfF